MKEDYVHLLWDNFVKIGAILYANEMYTLR